jgi:hypothetical protein
VCSGIERISITFSFSQPTIPLQTSNTTYTTKDQKATFVLKAAMSSPNAKRAKIVTSPDIHQRETAGRSNIIHIMSIIRTMKHQESTAYKPLPYLADDVGVTHKDREALVQWGFGILDACKVDRHFAIVAVSFFDRFLSCRGLRSVEACLARQREFQLAYVVSSSDQLCQMRLVYCPCCFY